MPVWYHSPWRWSSQLLRALRQDIEVPERDLRSDARELASCLQQMLINVGTAYPMRCGQDTVRKVEVDRLAAAH